MQFKWLAIVALFSVFSLPVTQGQVGGQLRFAEGCEPSGTLEMYTGNGSGWSIVCAHDSFSHVEAQVACNQLGFPFVTRLTEYNYSNASSQVVQSISCNGTETNITDCIVELGSECESGSAVWIECDESHNSSRGLLLVLFGDNGQHFSLIYPEQDIYQELCVWKSCFGAHFFDALSPIFNIIFSPVTALGRHCTTVNFITFELLIQCQNPAPQPTNVNLSDEGVVATFDCASGYDLNGGNTRVCTVNGTWVGAEPSCQPVDCGTLTSPINGSVAVPTTTYNSVATYSCVTGYELNGDTTRTCQSTRVWTGSDPTCQAVDCGTLTSPINGSVAVPTTTYNSVATYSCVTGFELNEDTTRTCQSNGTWSGSDLTCQPSTGGAGGLPTVALTLPLLLMVAVLSVLI